MTRTGLVLRLVRSNLRCGLSQVEVLISSIIVGVLMVASLSTIAASRRSQMLESSEARGMTIAQALMSEIAELPMREPTCDCGFGAETTENRTSFDDVDDYHGLVDCPPKSRNGVALQGVSDLKRTVDVAIVKSTDWNSTASTYEGVYT